MLRVRSRQFPLATQTAGVTSSKYRFRSGIESFSALVAVLHRLPHKDLTSAFSHGPCLAALPEFISVYFPIGFAYDFSMTSGNALYIRYARFAFPLRISSLSYDVFKSYDVFNPFITLFITFFSTARFFPVSCYLTIIRLGRGNPDSNVFNRNVFDGVVYL